MNQQQEQQIEELTQAIVEVKVDAAPPSSRQSVSPSEHEQDQVTAADESNGTDYYQRHHQSDFYEDTESQHHQQYFREHQQTPSQRISPIPYHYNKRMTGKKNISSIVVGENDKIEFDQVDDKLGFGVLKINRPIGVRSRSNTHEHLNDNESVHSRDSEHTHTDQGFFDLKFYHNRLW